MFKSNPAGKPLSEKVFVPVPPVAARVKPLILVPCVKLLPNELLILKAVVVNVGLLAAAVTLGKITEKVSVCGLKAESVAVKVTEAPLSKSVGAPESSPVELKSNPVGKPVAL